ncbi:MULTISPECIES: hypothetical protein [Calothrix]|nr:MULTISPECIES: hypothetical protein [Calothrix]
MAASYAIATNLYRYTAQQILAAYYKLQLNQIQNQAAWTSC